MLTCNDFAPIVHVLLIPIAKTSFVIHSITDVKPANSVIVIVMLLAYSFESTMLGKTLAPKIGITAFSLAELEGRRKWSFTL